MAKVPRAMSEDLLLEEIIVERVGESECSVAVFLGQGEGFPSARLHVTPTEQSDKGVNELCRAYFQSHAILQSPCPCSKAHTVGLQEAPFTQALLTAHGEELGLCLMTLHHCSVTCYDTHNLWSLVSVSITGRMVSLDEKVE